MNLPAKKNHPDLGKEPGILISDLFNTRAASIQVNQVIVPRSIEDLARVLRDNINKNKNNTAVKPITVVGGGHSTLCTRPGAIVIDLRTSAFNKVHVTKNEHNDETALYVDFGGGATLSDLSLALKGSGWSVPVGTYGSVGAGMVLQGGIGFLTRQFGLTIDQIVEADLITAKGEKMMVGKDNYEDLFWAVKGAGNQMGTYSSFCVTALNKTKIYVVQRLFTAAFNYIQDPDIDVDKMCLSYY